MSDRSDYEIQTNTQKIDGVNVERQAGRTGRPFSFNCTTNVAVGGWFNAAKAQLTFGTTGKVTGMASAFNAEITLPNWNVSSGGVYTALEVNYNFAANTVLADNTNYPQCIAHFKVGGTSAKVDAWEAQTNSGVFQFDGLTAAADEVFDAQGGATQTHALAIMIGTTRYWIMLATDPGA